MRIINIISNELIVEKQKLENELERILNAPNITTEEIVKTSIELINKLTQVSNTLLTWESYANRENKFFDKNNKSAGIRARKSAQELKKVLQNLRKEILEESKK